MIDINLFSPYIEEEKESKNKYLYILTGLISVILVTGIYIGWYFHTINKLEKDIAQMSSYLSSKKIQGKLTELEGKREQLVILEDYYSSVKGINGQIEKANIINTDIINNINSSIPKSIYFDSMKIADRIVEIHGISDSRTSLAEFQDELSSKKIFSNVYITSISRDQLADKYVFVLTLLVEGDKNETE